MWKINEIVIKNLNAFTSTNVLKLDRKKPNLLLYGENGSGKSSLFNILKDFYCCVNDEISFPIKSYRNRFIKDIEEISLKIKFYDESSIDSEDEVIITINNNKISKDYIADAFKLNSFLDYKTLLKIHSIPNDTLDLLDILFNGVLKHFQIEGGSTIGNLWKEIYEQIETVYDEEDALTFSCYNGDLALLQKNEKILNTVIKEITSSANNFLNYFESGCKIAVNLSSFETDEIEINSISKQRIEKPTLPLSVNYNTVTFTDSHRFFNEARLTAIILSIYFASIKTNPQKANHKLLFIDDVLIGLDNANRLPVLKILEKEFADYQIFITTFDRYWFELAKSQLNENWSTIELFENPLHRSGIHIFQSSLPNYEKAKIFFDLDEYPAAANYLRSECEEILKAKLQYDQNYKISFAHVPDRISLDFLWNTYKKRLNECGEDLEKDFINAFNLFQSFIFNPLSHSDKKVPIYKKEIVKMFEFVNQLKNKPIIKLDKIAVKGEIITYSHSSKRYELEIELEEDIYVKYGNITPALLKEKLRIKIWKKDGIDYWYNGAKLSEDQIIRHTTEITSLEDINKKVCNSISEVHLSDYYDKYYLNGESIQSILNSRNT